jgi:hypothetical protein
MPPAYSSVQAQRGSDKLISSSEVLGMHLALLAQISWVQGDLKLSMLCCMQISGKRFPVTDSVMSEVRLCTSRCLMEHGEYSDCLVQMGLSGMKAYNMQAMLEFCVCLVKCGNVDKANQILLHMLTAAESRAQQENQARLISGRIGSLRVLRDLDIVFAKCIMNSSIQSQQRNSDGDIGSMLADHATDADHRPLVSLVTELCKRCGTSVKSTLPKPQELLNWCLDQHFDHQYLDSPGILEAIAFDIKRQEDALKDDLHNEGNSAKIKQDSDSKLLSEILDKFEKWKQIVETWCVNVLVCNRVLFSLIARICL